MEETNMIAKEQMDSLGKLKEKFPEAMSGFMQFMKASETDGALSGKVKELVALGIAVKSQCHWCIALHVKKLIGMGATKDEMLEAGMVAVLWVEAHR